jgi:hypothetical protein
MTRTTHATPATPASSATPRRVRGRRTEAELAAIRERVEQLMLQNLRSPAIHRALTGPESPNPIAISERQVRNHMRAIERAWAERASREHLEVEYAKAIALAEETARTATVRSTLNARSNVGVGYLNASLKAQELVATCAASTRRVAPRSAGSTVHRWRCTLSWLITQLTTSIRPTRRRACAGGPSGSRAWAPARHPTPADAGLADEGPVP